MYGTTNTRNTTVGAISSTSDPMPDFQLGPVTQWPQQKKRCTGKSKHAKRGHEAANSNRVGRCDRGLRAGCAASRSVTLLWVRVAGCVVTIAVHAQHHKHGVQTVCFWLSGSKAGLKLV